MRLSFFALATLALLSACGDAPPIESTPNLTVVREPTGILPAPRRADIMVADRPSLIGPLDTIGVDVFRLPEFSREVRVDASGRVAMPLIGTVDARDKTAEELAKAIEAALRQQHVRDPHVTVNIKTSVSQVVTIDGQVIEPGLYPVTNQMTLMRAIASAKGLSEYAKEDDVVILRTVESKKMAGLYNLTAIRRGVYLDPPVYANDVIIVGNSSARRMFRDLVAVSPVLAAPIIAFLQ